MKRLISIIVMLLLCRTAMAQDQKPASKDRKFSFSIGYRVGFGGGYRLYIANKFKMDFSLGYVYNYTTNNSASQNAIQLGVALVF